MSDDKRMRVSIGAIDEDGEYSTVYLGGCTRARAMEIMQDILDESGLPVLDILGKHERPGDAVPKAGRTKCVKADRLTPEQMLQLTAKIKPVPGQMIVHAEFVRDGLRHMLTGPASWVQEQIAEAVKEAAKR